MDSSSRAHPGGGRIDWRLAPALEARGQIEGIDTATYLMQARSLALLVEREIQ
jgi:hypothetical protein